MKSKSPNDEKFMKLKTARVPKPVNNDIDAEPRPEEDLEKRPSLSRDDDTGPDPTMAQNQDSETIPAFHPAAEVFPMMSAADLSALAKDIEQNGLREPIVRTNDGTILDGRNRFAACRQAGVAPVFETWTGKAGCELEFVLSMNVHRRQLSESQRALAAARALPLIMKAKEAADSQVANLPPGGKRKSRDLLADMFNVGSRSVQHALKLRDHPDLAQSVFDGKVTVSRASALVGQPLQTKRSLPKQSDVEKELEPVVVADLTKEPYSTKNKPFTVKRVLASTTGS